MAKQTGSKSDNLSKRKRYELIRSKLLTERATYDKHWRELSDFILPRRSRFIVDDQNQDNHRRSNKIIDSTATRAARTLQSGLHSGVTPPNRPWFRLSTPDPELAEFAPVKEWLHTVTNRLSTVFLKSNIYNLLPTLYGDLGVFGSPAISVLEDDKELIRGYSYPVGSFAYGVSRRQIVDTFTMEFKMSVRQIIEEFGLIDGTRDIDWSNISRQVKNLWDKGNYENLIDIIWFIGPNVDYDPQAFESKYKPWTSCHWEKGGEQGVFLRDSGFDEFPILAPRWHTTGFDWYASDCPGMTCLSDVKQLQVMQKRKGQAIEIGINPSLQGPTSLKNQKVSLLPGDVTYVDALQQQNAAIRPIREVNLTALRFFTADIQDVREGIREAFFTNLFLALTQDSGPGRMTAREVAERHEEKLLTLSPVLERMNDELLDPLIDRSYAIMDRAGMIPPPPQELEGVQLKVEYVSILGQAQKMVAVSVVDRFLQTTVPLIEHFPIIKHKIQPLMTVNEYGDLLGVNPKLIVPDAEAEKAYQVEQEQIAKQQQLMQQEQASKAVKNLAGSNMDENNALKQMIEGGQ